MRSEFIFKSISEALEKKITYVKIKIAFSLTWISYILFSIFKKVTEVFWSGTSLALHWCVLDLSIQNNFFICLLFWEIL